jgi:hypothetical protein
MKKAANSGGLSSFLIAFSGSSLLHVSEPMNGIANVILGCRCSAKQDIEQPRNDSQFLFFGIAHFDTP